MGKTRDEMNHPISNARVRVPVDHERHGDVRKPEDDVDARDDDVGFQKHVLSPSQGEDSLRSSQFLPAGVVHVRVGVGDVALLGEHLLPEFGLGLLHACLLEPALEIHHSLGVAMTRGVRKGLQNNLPSAGRGGILSGGPHFPKRQSEARSDQQQVGKGPLDAEIEVEGGDTVREVRGTLHLVLHQPELQPAVVGNGGHQDVEDPQSGQEKRHHAGHENGHVQRGFDQPQSSFYRQHGEGVHVQHVPQRPEVGMRLADCRRWRPVSNGYSHRHSRPRDDSQQINGGQMEERYQMRSYTQSFAAEEHDQSEDVDKERQGDSYGYNHSGNKKLPHYY